MGGAMAVLARFRRHCHGNSLVHWYSSSPVHPCQYMLIPVIIIDVFLYSFLVPILPYMLESRLHVDVALTQRYSFLLLSLSAGISVVVSVPIGYLADRSSSKKVWLLSGLALVLVSTGAIALATSSMLLFFFFLMSWLACGGPGLAPVR